MKNGHADRPLSDVVLSGGDKRGKEPYMPLTLELPLSDKKPAKVRE